MTAHGIQWALWANEQGFASLLLLVFGAVVSLSQSSFFSYSGVSIFFALVLPILFIIEWPRPRLKGKAKTILRPYQSALHMIYETRIGHFASDYFFRSFLFFILAIPGLFSVTTVVGSLSLAWTSILYFLAAWNGEKWDCPQEDASHVIGLYARSTNRPIQYQDFVKSSRHRRRYWARNFVGWPRFGFHSPNSSHQTLANWEERDRVHWLITQNVDALHFKAGSRQVTELHGSAHRVICLKCHHVIQREEFQRKLEEANPDFLRSLFDDSEAAPDGDVQLTDEQVVDFVTPSCSRCGDGVLKPDIVFFGDNVASNVKEFCCQKLEESDCLLVVGSSLFVYSGYRFALKAKEAGIPLAILNIGETRADHLADVKVQGICSAVLRTVEDETLWNVAGT